MTKIIWTPPAPQQQLVFLKNVQRLLAEGSFVSSYKFALLHALADLAVRSGDDSGAPLLLSTEAIAERFIELYWLQARPFKPTPSASAFVLRQNTGRQAEIVTKVCNAQNQFSGSLFRLKSNQRAWQLLRGQVARVVSVMPLWKLQTLARDRLDFLYENAGAGAQIELRPGVAFCLRGFYDFITSMVRTSWLDYVRRYNAETLGDISDLQAFLFGQDRSSLAAVRPFLLEAQQGQCFYCPRKIGLDSEVDHFIPWSRYACDWGANFVLSCKACNGNKSDFLAYEEHLEAWHGRNTSQRALLTEAFGKLAIPCDFTATLQVARWFYHQTEAARGQVWIKGKNLSPLSNRWVTILAS